MNTLEFLRTCEGYNRVEIRAIDEDAYIAFDPEEDTEIAAVIWSNDRLMDLPKWIQNSEIQAWYMDDNKNICMCVA